MTALRALGFAFGWVGILVVLTIRPADSSVTHAALHGQDVLTLDRRISTLEQRLFMIESNVSQLQQQLQYATRQTAPAATRDPEIERLRLQYELLLGRLTEIECGLAKLDERTLPADLRASKTRNVDPCRSLPNTPLQLSSHPR